MKVIPAIDLMDGQVVRLVQGRPENKTVYSNNPLEIAQKWEKQGADMLHIVDLDATLSLGTNLELIKKITKNVSIPVQVAGGLRSESLISTALDFANRIVLGTLAFKEKPLTVDLGKKFGHNRLVISADHHDGKIVTNGWTQSSTIPLIDAIIDFKKKRL